MRRLLPAVLLVSTAAGLLVTRVGQGDTEGRLGADLGHQLLADHRALATAAALMLILAAVPALPAWPFLFIGTTLGLGAAVRLVGKRRRDAESAAEDARLPGDAAAKGRAPHLDETSDLVQRLARDRPVLTLSEKRC